MTQTTILGNTIVVEVNTDNLYWRLQRQDYSDGTSFYCLLKDKYDFCPIETSSSNLDEIIKHIEKEVNGRGKNMNNYNKEGKQIILKLIEDGKKFLYDLHKYRQGQI